ncbi:MAG: hypothetical protein H7A23_04395 [Leptospiraceae bacterium]|nr:hypothetical protein [Leptospiraceae bacterium]MCP5493773.1 hypothetical protein [Leptospiraceae bacterium]
MIVRLVLYLVFLVVFCEGIALSAVAWSFYESAENSFNLLKNTSDKRAIDLHTTLARVAETKMDLEVYDELTELFMRTKQQSLRQDNDKLNIKEIFLLSPDAVVLAHSDISEVSIDLAEFAQPSEKYNKAFYMRALRMKKGQNPIPQKMDDGEQLSDYSSFSKLLMKLFPEIKYQSVILSGPIYHVDNLEVTGTLHLIYNRGNFLLFIEQQKEILVWMTLNYSLIALLCSIILWVLFIFFSFITIKEGIRQLEESGTIDSGNISLNEQMTVKNTMTFFLQKLDNFKSKTKKVEINDMTSNNTVVNAKKLHPENIEEELPTKTRQVSATESVENNKNDKSKEVLDAIYLD